MGMLYGKILRSPHPHAKIKHIDTRRAEKLPGVRAVLSHKNTPKIPFRQGQTFVFDELVFRDIDPLDHFANASVERLY